MGWVALDDGFFANPKILQAGHAAAGLYAMGLAYCGKYATDGFLPKAWVAGHPRKLVSTLIARGLWQEVDGGFRYPDYLEYNDGKEAIEERRQRARDAARTRWGNARGNAASNADSNAAGNADGNAQYSTVQTETTFEALSKGSGRRKRRGLPLDHRHELQRILSLVRNADEGTVDVWAHFASELPLASLAKVRETIEVGEKRVVAGYVTRALQSELKERAKSEAVA